MNSAPHNICPCSFCTKPKGEDGDSYYYHDGEVSICESCICDAVAKVAKLRRQKQPREVAI